MYLPNLINILNEHHHLNCMICTQIPRQSRYCYSRHKRGWMIYNIKKSMILDNKLDKYKN